ncbi:hypothetical protein B296_00038714 [Ensete ventricosum]|uniref:Uncharacterized protein n=1 Tax=Ensete ventricosum TaxID=4639 RepID=A0A426X232_ENSVE|nr:hypothetical protein B296_00038714 [Ensete ventricosum]
MAEATTTKSDNVGVGATTIVVVDRGKILIIVVGNNIDNSGGQRQNDSVGVGTTSIAKEVATLMIAMKRGKEAALVQSMKEEDGYGGCCQCRHRRGSGDGAVGSSVIKVKEGKEVARARGNDYGGDGKEQQWLIGDSGYDLEAEGSSDDSTDVREGLARFYSDSRRRTAMIVRVGKKREMRTMLMARLRVRTLARGVLI